MSWYNGSISDGIALSKQSGKMIIIYISGNDSASMNEVWEKEKISTICKKECVCIKLESESTAGRQFAQIYPVLVVPCTYLIGVDGLPIEIVGGEVTEDELFTKIEHALQVRKNTAPSSQKTVSTSSGVAASTSKSSASTSKSPTSSSKSPTTSQSPSASSTKTPSDPTSPSTPDLPTDSLPSRPETDAMFVSSDDNTDSTTASQAQAVEMRTRMAQEKIRQRRKARTEQAEEDERRKEMERRNLGKQAQCVKEKQEETKRIRELEERRKEKLAEQEALERVRDEIARDRAEKNRRFKEEAEVRRVEQEKKQEELRKKKEQEEKQREFERRMMARIQYRFPDGSAINRTYTRDTTLRSCMDDLIENEPKKLPKAFQFFTTIPRCVFDSDDEELTLAHLGLVPTASVYIRPKTTPVLSGGQRGCIGAIIAFMVFVISIPFKFAFWFWNKLTGSAPIPPRTSTGQRDSPPPSIDGDSRAPSPAAGARSSRGLRKRDVSTKETRREGNMHRLHDVRKDDDDESATWNGNSTQQM